MQAIQGLKTAVFDSGCRQLPSMSELNELRNLVTGVSTGSP